MTYRVLILEDDPMVAAIDRQYVESDRHFQVVQVCKSGGQALEYLAHQDVELIVLDYYTPEMNGQEFLDHLHAMGQAPAVIMVTSASDTDIVRSLLSRGVQDYLVKPFEFARFRQALDRFLQRQKLLSGSQVLVIDTNIPAESIAYLAENCPVPIFADPVSTAKAVKLQPVLGRLHTLKPNRIEAELLSGVAITDEASLRAAADALLATGLHRVFISLGGDGVFAADRSGERVHLPVLPAEMVNTTGCGDAFMAAITWAYLAGTDLTGTAKAGLAASAIAMEGAETINPAMSAETLKRRAGL